MTTSHCDYLLLALEKNSYLLTYANCKLKLTSCRIR